ncbi:MAG: 50S ribosomal protein L17 [Planctomycetes bacterium]|nr:50S ribosomal protein L17 [Planctomycetota bacterium]
MRHRVAGRKLNRSRPHYRRLMQNLMCQLFQHHRIVTTVEKAKEVRPQAERLITLAREKTLANVRRAVTELGSNRQAKDTARHLFDDIAPLFADRPGGYLRILRLSDRRLGDGGERAIIELVNYEPVAAEEEA